MKFSNRVSEAKPRTGDVTGFIGEGIELRGDLRFKDTLRVDGKVQAAVRSDGELVLGPTGVLEGDISLGTLTVSGRVKGTLRIKDRLEVHPGGRVEGEIVLARPGLVVHDGGVIEAQVQMGTVKQEAREAIPQAVEKRRAAVMSGAGAV